MLKQFLIALAIIIVLATIVYLLVRKKRTSNPDKPDGNVVILTAGDYHTGHGFKSKENAKDACESAGMKWATPKNYIDGKVNKLNYFAWTDDDTTDLPGYLQSNDKWKSGTWNTDKLNPDSVYGAACYTESGKLPTIKNINKIDPNTNNFPGHGDEGADGNIKLIYQLDGKRKFLIEPTD